MTPVSALLNDSPWLHSRCAQALGWTLVHSLWELALAAAFLASTFWLLRRRSSNLRYVIGCGGMLAMCAALVVTFFVVLPRPNPPAPAVARSAPIEFTAAPVADLPAVTATWSPAIEPAPLPLRIRIQAQIKPWLPNLVAIYFAGAVLFALRLAAGYWRITRLLRGARPVLGRAQRILVALEERLGISRLVALLESPRVDVPAMMGTFRPVILLPACALTGLSEEQLMALLAHELAHIRRHDYLVNLLQSFVETLLFYHPAVWWLSARIRQERENCCDDLAVAVTGNRLAYAKALAAMETMRSAPRLPEAVVLGARGGRLLPRIQRLLGFTPAPRPLRTASAAALLVLFLLSMAYIGCNRQEAPATGAQSAADTAAPHDAGATQPADAPNIAFDVEVVAVPASFFDDFRVGWERKANAKTVTTSVSDGRTLASQTKNLDLDATVIDDWTANILKSAIKGEQRSLVLAAPRVLLTNGQAVTLSIGEDPKSPPSGDKSPATQPSQSALDSIRLDLTATASADRRQIALKTLSVMDVITGVDTFTTTDPKTGKEWDPVYVSRKVATHIEDEISLPDGGTLFIKGPPLPGKREVETPGAPAGPDGKPVVNRAMVDDDRVVLYLVRASVVAKDGEAGGSSQSPKDQPTRVPMAEHIGGQEGDTYRDLIADPVSATAPASAPASRGNWGISVSALEPPQSSSDILRTVDSEANTAARQRLNAEMPRISYQSAPLGQVLDRIRTEMAANIFVNWPALQAVGIDRSTPVSVDEENATYRVVLSRVLFSAANRSTDLGFIVIDGNIHISSQEELRSRDVPVYQAYDIRDMLIQQLPGQALSNEQMQQRADLVNSIMDTIRSQLARATWIDNGGAMGTIREMQGWLVVRQTIENQLAIFHLLEHLRETRPMRVAIESRLNLIPPAVFGGLPVTWNIDIPAGQAGAHKLRASILDNWSLNQLLMTLQTGHQVSVDVTAGRATFFNGQTGAITVSQGETATLLQARTNIDILQREVIDKDLTYRTVAERPDSTLEQKGQALTALERTRGDLLALMAAYRAASDRDRRASLGNLQIAFTCSASADRRSVILDVRPASLENAAATAVSGLPIATELPMTSISIPDGGTLLLDAGNVTDADGSQRRMLMFVRPSILVYQAPQNDLLGVQDSTRRPSPAARGVSGARASAVGPDDQTTADRNATVADLTGRARRLYDAGRFVEANDAIEQALALDPGNEAAHLTRRLIQDKLVSRDAERVVHQPETEPAHTINAQETSIPYADQIVYFDRPPENGRMVPEQMVADREARASLNEKVSLHADHQSLEKTIDQVRALTKSKIDVHWRELRAAGVTRGSPVSLDVHNLPLRQLVSALLADAAGGKSNLTFAVANGAILISSKEELESTDYQMMRVFDVRDLIDALAAKEGAAPSAETRDAAAKELIARVTRTIAPDSWGPGRPGSIRVVNGQIVVNQVIDNLVEVPLLLQQIRQAEHIPAPDAKAPQVLFTSVLTRSPMDFIALMAAGKGSRTATAIQNDPNSLAISFLSFDDAAAQKDLTGKEAGAASRPANATTFPAAFAELQAKGLLNILSQPQFLVFDRQLAEITLGDGTPYVSEYRQKTPGDPASDWAPKTSMVRTGFTLGLKPFVTGDGSVRVELTIGCSHLERVDTLPAPGTPPEKGLKIQKPVIKEEKLTQNVMIKDGKTIAMAIPEEFIPEKFDKPNAGGEAGKAAQTNPATTRPAKPYILFITPRILPPEDATTAPATQAR